MPAHRVYRYGRPKRLPKRHPLHIRMCPVHNVPFVWKHEIRWLPLEYHGWSLHRCTPIRVCPNCLLAARLIVQGYLAKRTGRHPHRDLITFQTRGVATLLAGHL